MRLSKNSYTLLGSGLILAGVMLTPVAYLLLHSIPLTSLGLSIVILGAVCIALERTLPKTSPEASTILLETGLENIAAIVEELGLRSKAIYLPSSLTGGQPQALIPLHSGSPLPQIKQPLPGRLIVKYGNRPEDIGLLVVTPGSSAVRMLETKPEPTSGGLEAALSSVLMGMIDVADTIRVGMTDQRISVEVSRPRLEYKNIWFYERLGSPLASIVASIAAEALDKPIAINHEKYDKAKGIIELGILE